MCPHVHRELIEIGELNGNYLILCTFIGAYLKDKIKIIKKRKKKLVHDGLLINF